jgi:hypothetical protein
MAKGKMPPFMKGGKMDEKMKPEDKKAEKGKKKDAKKGGFPFQVGQSPTSRGGKAPQPPKKK